MTRASLQLASKDPKWAHELLEEAFDTALVTYLPEPVMAVPPSEVPMKALPLRIEKAIAINGGLDRLSLRIAAAEGMAALDPLESVRMLREISFPEASVASCTTELLPDPSKYFLGAAAILAAALPGADPKHHNDWINTLESTLAKATSPAYLRSLLQLPELLKLSPEERTRIIDVIATSMTAATNDSRAWEVTMQEVTDQMLKLLPRSNGVERAMLLRAWRVYLLYGFAAPQCQEAVDPKFPYTKARADAVHALNAQIQANNGLGVMPIADDDMKSGDVEPGLTTEQPPQSMHLQSLQKLWLELQFGSNGGTLPDEQKRAPEWSTKYSDYLNKIENVSTDDIPKGEDLFWWKSQYMSAAAMVAPPGSLRDDVVIRFLGTLSQTTVSAENVYQWYSLVTSWIRTSELFGFPKDKLQALIQSKGGSLMALVVALNRLPQ